MLLIGPNPLYDELRDELSSKGNYPNYLITNIGITNGVLQGGRIDSPAFNTAAARDGTQIMHAKSKTGYWTDFSLNMNHPGYGIQNYKICYFHVCDSRRSCPSVVLHDEFNHLTHVAGSTVDFVTDLVADFNDESPGSAVQMDEGVYTFIPAVSALDMDTNNRVLNIENNANLSPFDIIIGNTFNSNELNAGNFRHNLISDDIADNITNLLNTLELNRPNTGQIVTMGAGGTPVASTTNAQVILTTGHVSVADAQLIASLQSQFPTEINITNSTEKEWLQFATENAGSSRLLDIRTITFGSSIF